MVQFKVTQFYDPVPSHFCEIIHALRDQIQNAESGEDRITWETILSFTINHIILKCSMEQCEPIPYNTISVIDLGDGAYAIQYDMTP